MVGRQAIVSPLFGSKGKLSVNLMRSLMVRGGGLLVNDCLQRFGWSGRDPVITTIFTTDIESGMIRGVRYETRGQGPELKFPASELWQTEENVTVTLKLPDLSILTWQTEGEYRNQTTWLDSTELEVEASHHERGSLTDRELEELDIGFCVRFTVIPMKVDKAMLYGGIVPISKDDLRTRLEDMGADLSSPNIPTIALKLGFSKGVHTNGLLLTLMPTEDPQDKVGLGHVPLLESIGSMAPTFPDTEEVAKQLSQVLRNNHPTNNVNVSRLRGILQADSLPSATPGQVRFEWPQYQPSRQPRNTSGQQATGQACFPFLILLSVRIEK